MVPLLAGAPASRALLEVEEMGIAALTVPGQLEGRRRGRAIEQTPKRIGELGTIRHASRAWPYSLDFEISAYPRADGTHVTHQGGGKLEGPAARLLQKGAPTQASID
jgi:hypothetical protein